MHDCICIAWQAMSVCTLWMFISYSKNALFSSVLRALVARLCVIMQTSSRGVHPATHQVQVQLALKLPQQLRQVNHHYPPSASALQVNLLYHSIACPCLVVLPSLHTVSSCILRFDSNMSGSAASFVPTIVSHASAGQNGFGSSFGTPAPQGNGNQEEEEEEAQAPEEPVSLFTIASCCRCVIQQPAGALN